MTLRYSVRIEDPLQHYAAFRLRFEATPGRPVDLVLPAWVPGSYHIQDLARNVVDLSAADAEQGAPIPVRRVEKARWRLEPVPAAPIEVRYRVYGHQAITEALDVTAEHLFLNGTVCLPYVDGRKEEVHEIALDLPPGWRAVTELEEVSTHPPTYRAPTYDELVDAPIDCGTARVLTLSPGGIRHRISLCGDGGNFEVHRLEEDVGKIVAATIRYFGDSPLHGYTFFYHLSERSDGGLEHLTSNSCVVPRQTFRPETAYQWWLWLTAHEYFHLYEVKRIRPKVLGPFDYTREVYTRLLWLMEGTTDYVSLLLLRRAGLHSPAKYLERLAGEAKKLLTTPGRHHQSLEEASLLAWIDYYRPDEESRNRSVSYYIKGHLVSLALDLELRERTENRASMQDVLRHLWTEYGRSGRGLDEDEFPSIVARSTGVEIADFHRRYIAGTDELDLDAFARFAGLHFAPVPRKVEPEEDGEPGYLGVEYRVQDGTIRVSSVVEGGPARRAGISPGDEIVAVDGVRVAATEMESLLKRFPPGTDAEIDLFRRGYLTHVPLTFGRPPPEKYAFTPLDEATSRQKAIYEGWLEAKWEPPKKPPAA